ncbi:Ku protein [Taklimakanibacter albus]|uniref:Ku protein n=1 Tax=Taklimakanibacter albus TaxID=2800327 RepID=A0ACC5R3K8_9HYPH|nr:Ku protein [Aestuariivirga sp. YIM B02566]MBK1867256.1 Ku protein [Aestuariivirga sp. YIM B02566]
MRAQWKGHLRLSLVTIAVELHAATEASARPSLHQLDKKSGKRIRYEKIVPGKGKVADENIVKGFELGSGKHVILTPEELDKIKLATKHSIELSQFVDYCDIDPRYFERPYYLTPADDVSAEGYVVIREALKAAKKAGIGQMVMRGKENLVAVRPCGDGLLLETLRYADELKKSDKAFSHVPAKRPAKDMIELATELIERKSGPFKPAAFKDHYGDALKALVAEKRKRGKVTDVEEDETPRPKGDNVIDLMDALKKSIGGKSAAAPKPRKPAPRKKARR